VGFIGYFQPDILKWLPISPIPTVFPNKTIIPTRLIIDLIKLTLTINFIYLLFVYIRFSLTIHIYYCFVRLIFLFAIYFIYFIYLYNLSII